MVDSQPGFGGQHGPDYPQDLMMMVQGVSASGKVKKKRWKKTSE